VDNHRRHRQTFEAVDRCGYVEIASSLTLFEVALFVSKTQGGLQKSQ
jgi:hypothetical protein